MLVNDSSPSIPSPTPHSILLNSRHQSITLLFYTDQLTVWVGNNSFTGEEVFTNVTTWVSLQRHSRVASYSSARRPLCA